MFTSRYMHQSFYFLKGRLIFTNFSNKAAVALEKTPVPKHVSKQNKNPPYHILHPSYIPIHHLLDEWHPMYSKVMGRRTPLLYHVQITEDSLLLLQINGLDCDNNKRIHLDFHTGIQIISCLHSWSISTLLLSFSFSLLPQINFMIIKMGILT